MGWGSKAGVPSVPELLTTNCQARDEGVYAEAAVTKHDFIVTLADKATTMKVSRTTQKAASEKTAEAASGKGATDMLATVFNDTTAAGLVEDGKSCTDKDKSLDMRIPPSGVGADPTHHHGATSIATQGAAAIMREFDSTLCRPPERVSGTGGRKGGTRG